MAGRLILGIANPALDSNGNIDASATLTFYANLTTTPQAVYSDQGLTTPLANPLTADSAGRFPQIWAADGNTYSVKWTPTGASAITYDYIINSNGSGTYSLVTTNGVKFPAVQVPSADPNTLDDYEEGTWTPTDQSGAGLVFTSVNATYTKIGNQVRAAFALTYPVTADGSSAVLGGLPFTSANIGSVRQGFISRCGSGVATQLAVLQNDTRFSPTKIDNSAMTNAQNSGSVLFGTLIYSV